jgi:hypothetical protein
MEKLEAMEIALWLLAALTMTRSDPDPADVESLRVYAGRERGSENLEELAREVVQKIIDANKTTPPEVEAKAATAG